MRSTSAAPVDPLYSWNVCHPAAGCCHPVPQAPVDTMMRPPPAAGLPHPVTSALTASHRTARESTEPPSGRRPTPELSYRCHRKYAATITTRGTVLPSPGQTFTGAPCGVARRPMPLPEAGDEAALPGCLHRACRIMRPDVGDRLAGGHPVEHGEAGQRGAGSPAPAGAGDLDALGGGPRPCLAQRLPVLSAVGRQPEVRPAQPASLPGDRGRLVAQQGQSGGGDPPLRAGGG